jgi:hypothetical protein
VARKKGGLGVLGIVVIVVLVLLLLSFLKQNHIHIPLPTFH